MTAQKRLPEIPDLDTQRLRTAKNDATGESFRYRVKQRVKQAQHDKPEKVLVLELIERDDAANTKHLRFGYFIYSDGKWHWSRFSPMAYPDDFKKLLEQGRSMLATQS